MADFNLGALDRLEDEFKKDQETSKSYSILCVDDEVVNLKTLQNLLEHYYNVFTAENAADGLKIIESNKIDVVITDQRMPGMQGTEFLEELKIKNLTDNIRIILTGYTDINDLIKCINNGLIDRYVIKPWNEAELLEIIQQSITRITTNRTLNKLLPEQFIKKLYPEGLENVKVGYGTELDCVILFADIRGFTSLSEDMAPLDSFKMISSYFNFISPVISDHNGFIDKFLGDGIMAIFNRKDQYEEDALKCAAELVKSTAEYNKNHRKCPKELLKPGWTPRESLNVAMGLYSGNVIIGTVGTDDRLDFTVLGDAVNTAARIQGISSRLSTSITIPEAMISSADKYKKRYIGKLPLRGKKVDMGFWELLEGDAELNTNLILSYDVDFQKAIKLCNQGMLSDASIIFENILKKNPNDTVAQFYLKHKTETRVPY